MGTHFLSTADWKEIDDSSPLQVYPAATELFQQDSLAQEVYLIEHGLVKLVHLEPDGCELVIMLRFPGWLLGAATAILQQPSPVTAITLTKCHLRRISSRTFLRQLQSNTALSWHLHQILSREVFDQVTRVVQIGCLSARQRLEQLLWQLISAQESNQPQKEVRLQVSLKHSEIAELIAVNPSYLSRLLNQLEQKGTLRRRKGWLTVPEPQQLWH